MFSSSGEIVGYFWQLCFHQQYEIRDFLFFRNQFDWTPKQEDCVELFMHIQNSEINLLILSLHLIYYYFITFCGT